MRIKFFVAIAVLATAFLCSGGFVKAQTPTDTQALIAQLQAQIQTLMQQIAQLQGQQGTAGWCHTFSTYLVAGSTSGDISYLQTALTKSGFDVSGDDSGSFGDSTAAAVVQFQGKYGITQTGTVGPKTRAKLNALYGCGIILNPQPANQCTQDSDCPVKTIVCAPGMVCPSPKCTNGQCITAPPFNKSCNTTSDCLSGQVCNNGLCGTTTQPPVTTQCNQAEISQIMAQIAQLTAGPQSQTVQLQIQLLQTQLNQLSAQCSGGTTQPSITVTSPKEGDMWKVGTSYTISWSAGSTPTAGFYVYLNGGGHDEGYSKLIMAQPDTWSLQYTPTVADLPVNSGNSWVILVCAGSLVSGGNNCARSGQIWISPAQTTVQPSITVISPNGGETWTMGQTYNITWTSNGVTNASVYLQFSDGGTCLLQTVPASQNSLSVSITNGMQCPNISRTITAGQYKVFIIGDSMNGPRDFSDNYFNIVAPITYGGGGGGGGQTLTCTGQTMSNIDYFTQGTSSNSRGDSLTDYCVSGFTSYNLLKGYCGANGSVLNTGYLCPNGCNNGACNRQPTPTPTITITSPAGGEQWAQGSTHNITWTSTGVSNVNIVSGDFASITIGTNVAASAGTYSWTIPTTVTPGNYAITIYDVNNGSSVKTTGQQFTVVAAAPTYNYPTVTVPTNSNASGLVVGVQMLGQTTVAASSQGDAKVEQIVFNSTVTGGATMASPFLADNSGNPIQGSSCSISGATATCTFSRAYQINRGNSQTFEFWGTISGNLGMAGSSSVSISLSPSGFVWDDIANSANGLTGQIIPGFPTNSFTIHN